MTRPETKNRRRRWVRWTFAILAPAAFALAGYGWLDKVFTAAMPAAPTGLAGGPPGIAAEDGPFPELAAPPDTELFFPMRGDDRFQAVFESAWPAGRVLAYYAEALAARGFLYGTPEGIPDAHVWRRGRWRVDLMFFPPDAGSGSDYRLSVLKRADARRAPDTEPTERSP